MSLETTPNPVATGADEQEFRAMDISIAGTPHRIICPASEVKNLELSAEYINQKIRDLRREIRHKNPTNEEFLLFVSLELHDQVQALKKQLAELNAAQSQAQQLIEKINKDAQAMLR